MYCDYLENDTLVNNFNLCSEMCESLCVFVCLTVDQFIYLSSLVKKKKQKAIALISPNALSLVHEFSWTKCRIGNLTNPNTPRECPRSNRVGSHSDVTIGVVDSDILMRAMNIFVLKLLLVLLTERFWWELRICLYSYTLTELDTKKGRLRAAKQIY